MIGLIKHAWRWLWDFRPRVPPDPMPAPAVIVPTNPDRRLVSVGVNHYQGSPQNALRGCVPDAHNVRRELGRRGWSTVGEPLLDGRATRAATLERIGSAASELRARQVLLVQWSSHGTRIPDPTEPDGLIEAIVPTDGCLGDEYKITARDLLAVLRVVHHEARVVLMIDACHSGIPEVDAQQYRGLLTTYRKPRMLLGTPEPRPGQRVVTMGGGVAGQIPTPWTRTVLLSGCRSDQTSADAYLDGGYCGAMTWSFLGAIAAGRPLAEIHLKMGLTLAGRGFEQEPQLMGSAENRGLAIV